MYNVVLVNLPFADISVPSIALTQLKHVVEEAHPAARVRVLNLNHEFARYFGEKHYQEVAVGLQHHAFGLGDWLFRRAAFPAAPDNAEEYFNRYYPRRGSKSSLNRDVIAEKREGIEDFFARMIAKYEIAGARLVGLTSMFSQNMACIALARAVKRIDPTITTVMGGANCEHPMGIEIVENADVIDHVFSGPGLISFPAFVGNQIRGAADPAAAIAGIFSKGKDPGAVERVIGDELSINVRIPLEYDEFLDSFERFFPDSPTRPSLTFETSRGCWWGEKSHCTFCGLNGLSMNYRSMEPAVALEQFESLFAYAPRVSRYKCVDNILPKSYVKEVLPHLNTPDNTSIFYEVKADLSEADVRTLAEARVFTIQPGVEAMSSTTLKLMKKGTTSFQNLTLLKHCIAYGVRPEWNLLVGFPGEKEDTFEKYVKDVPLLVHLEPPSGAFPVRFDRFSPYFTQAESYGLDLQPYDFYAMTYPFPEASIGRLAFYFMDRNYDADYFVGMVTWLSQMQKQVELWNARWAGGFDERPRLEFRVRDGREVVFDSRGVVPVEHALSDRGLEILRHLKTQSAADRLETALAPIPKGVLESELGALKKLGLVFEENGRLMSLVLDYPPTKAETRTDALASEVTMVLA